MSEMICPCCGQYIDVSEIRADAIDECIEKLYEVTPQTADEKLDMVFVNALRELKEQK